MIREAQKCEEQPILNFLSNYAHTSMFLRSNLLDHGLFDRASPHGSTYLVYEDKGHIAGVLGWTNNGYLMCQCPDAPTGLWAAFANWMTGRKIAGVTGVVDQVTPLLQALGYPDDAFSVLRDEPFYDLALADLDAPHANVRRPTPDDLSLLTEWIYAYVLETGIEADLPETRAIVQDRARIALNNGKVWILVKEGVPVSTCGINATAGDTVQIGQVFTPKDHRGKGFAGQAVAGMLRQVQVDGITQAVLFAASQDAARAYEKIGFKHKGFYKMALLKGRQIYEGPQ